MNDHTSQYIVSPAAEYFDAFTHFSTMFYFITPNMISFFHLALAFVASRFVANESLYYRRIGVLMYEVRTFLDTMDGVVFRSHTHTKGNFISIHYVNSQKLHLIMFTTISYFYFSNIFYSKCLHCSFYFKELLYGT